jgi:hypothetical protein
MESLPVCEKCGLRTVREELERNGIVLKFCDYCYWGEAEAEDSSAGQIMYVEKAFSDVGLPRGA